MQDGDRNEGATFRQGVNGVAERAIRSVMEVVRATRASGLRVKLLYSSAFLSTVAGAEASGSRIRDAVMLSELSADKKTSLTDGDD